MSGKASKLLEAALELPENERADLAARLLESLDESGPDADYEAEWAAEIERRISDIKQGRVQTIPWPEARRMIVDDADDSGRS